MLTHLYIQNVAVIEKVYIDFDKGLNIFTGETGAGKSVVIDAINAVLGSRTSRDLVRTGEEKAVISAVFDQIPASVRLRLAEYGMEPDEDELLIQREISADGRTGARVCGRPVTVNMLREIG
ncbi:MAG TPA: AAA family ATPase, partial [Firmicutes bacterium]|nr:AAA family ATPase [Bacillota bacterium]